MHTYVYKYSQYCVASCCEKRLVVDLLTHVSWANGVVLLIVTDITCTGTEIIHIVVTAAAQ